MVGLLRPFKRMLERIRARSLRQRLECMEPVFAAHADFLDRVYARSCNGTDKTRFMLLWCEMAEVCHVPPTSLHEDDQIADRFPGPTGWRTELNNPLEDLVYLVTMESRQLPLPASPPKTIGDVLRYLLQAR
jgi:hypothetical protein